MTSEDPGLSYDVVGPPDGPPMVLLHGLGETRASWAGVLPRLTARHRVVVVDLPGHGASPWPGSYSTAVLAEQVVALLDRLRLAGGVLTGGVLTGGVLTGGVLTGGVLTGVVLVGHSLGGAVAYRVVLARPDLVARLVVEDAPPFYPRERPVPDRPDGELDFDWAVVTDLLPEVNAGDPATWAALPSIGVPTLLIAGGPSSPVAQERLEEVANLVPDCRLVTVDVGHHVHEQAPGPWADAVLDWLA